MRRFWILVLLLLATFPISAQDDLPPAISADNVAQLQSIMLVNFDEPNRVMPDSGAGYTVPRSPDTLHEEYWKPNFQTGWFGLFDNGYGVMLATQSAIYFMTLVSNDYIQGPSYVWWGILAENGLVDFYYQYDMSAWVYRSDNTYYVKLNDFFYGGITKVIEINSNSIPLGIWTHCESEESGDCGAWLEIEYLGIESRSEVVRLPYIHEMDGIVGVRLDDDDLVTIPYAPAQDPEAVVRIGRIPLPYVVTSSETGIVKLWNIQTGDVLYEVDNGTGQPSVFGNINADASHFVWRDNASETLYLLDFETAENREVAQLNGEYAQWFFLSNDASTILAVNLNFEPIVVAWDVETGEKTVLGEYRQCNRPQPDMARLSRDGTTLVIGCDTGLDVWRVVEDE